MNIIPIILAIGTYTANTGSQGIYLLELDVAHKTAKIVHTIPASNPSYLQYIDEKSTLYYVEETGQGTVNTVEIHPDKSFKKSSSASTQGGSPCHVTVSPDHKSLIVSNYATGNFTTYALRSDGTIDKPLAHYQFKESSINPSRQKQSYIHSATYTTNGKKVFVQDLGGDQLYQFKAKDILRNNQPYTSHRVTPGGGPRHIAFAPNGQFVYILNEINGTIEVCSLTNKGDIQTTIQKLPMDNMSGENGAAHIRISADGRFLYASNRADKNCIAVFSIGADGQVTLVQVINSGGKGPRNFEFSPDEKHLLVANQLSNNITVFARDSESGVLTDMEFQVEIPSPVCIVNLK